MPLPSATGCLGGTALCPNRDGRRPEEFPPDARVEMLARYPLLGFGAEFLACFEDQARRKPGSAAAASVDTDVAGRIAANPLESHPPPDRGARIRAGSTGRREVEPSAWLVSHWVEAALGVLP
jgi:hypothetical protein